MTIGPAMAGPLAPMLPRHIDIPWRMRGHMRTTVRLDEALLERARREATKRQTTLTALIEQGLELVLRRPLKRPDNQPVMLPECRAGGGTLPGVDLNDSASLLDRMERRD